MDGLEIRGLSKRFGQVQAVDDLSISVPRGELIGFLGPNGAGKTTAMRSILGMVAPDAGEITWNGEPIGAEHRRHFGYMPQERGLYARMKAHEQVQYFGELAGLSRSDAADKASYWLERVGLSDRLDSLVQELSGGNQQRVQLAVSLVHDPDLLVLDEPFAGLDPVAAENMLEIINERAASGVSVLFSSHQLDLVEGLAEDVVIISEGKQVAAGAISDLRSASPTRRVRVRWNEPIVDWQPFEGTLVSFDGRSAVVDVSSSSDPSAHMSHAIAAGSVAEFGFEPPGLDEVFHELTVGEVVT